MTDYTDCLLDPDRALAMFKRYAIACTDGNRVGVNNQDMTGAYEEIKHGTVGDDNLLRYVKLFKAMGDSEFQAGVKEVRLEAALAGGTQAAFDALPGLEQMRRGDLGRAAQLEYEASHRAATNRGASTLVSDHAMAPAADRVPCYFLPWNGEGGVIQLTIPELPDDAAADTHPPIFLTAALSGCSIFVSGTARKPTIYHCGKDGATAGESATAFWTGAMQQILGDDAADNLSAAHNRDYMATNRGAPGSGAEFATSAKERFEEHYRTGYRVEASTAWGAVFGIRKGATWEFYLQENVTVTYSKLLPPTGFFKRLKKSQPDPAQRIVSRPVMVRKIFPDGGGVAQLLPTWRTLRY